MIRILTGFSERGGSTVALSNLANSLNEAGYETLMYGPHRYHLNRCKGALLTRDVFGSLDPRDSIITHFLKLPSRPKGKRVVLSCHEKWWFDVGAVDQYWDEAVFLHAAHREYHHKYKGAYSIIPNIVEPLVRREKKDLEMVAGIVGSIEDRKQTHISIQRALRDGCRKIYLFGKIGEKSYYNTNVRPLLRFPQVVEYGYAESKQEMYDLIGRVYHSSRGEVACLVKDECWSTGTRFFGNAETEHEVSGLSKEEVIGMWKKVLAL